MDVSLGLWEVGGNFCHDLMLEIACQHLHDKFLGAFGESETQFAL